MIREQVFRRKLAEPTFWAVREAMEVMAREMKAQFETGTLIYVDDEFETQTCRDFQVTNVVMRIVSGPEIFLVGLIEFLDLEKVWSD